MKKERLYLHINKLSQMCLLRIISIIYISILLSQCKQSTQKQSTQRYNVDFSLPDALVGDEYEYMLKIQEVDSNCVISFNEKSLPYGLCFDSSENIIHGIPEENGTYYLEFSIFDTISNIKSEKSIIRLKINLPEGVSSSHQFYISTKSPLPTAYLGENYNVKLKTRNKINSVEWQCNSLPSGLNFDSNTGSINGVPRVKGWFCINVIAKDIQDATIKDSKTFALRIMNPESRILNSSDDNNSPRKIDDLIGRLECGTILFDSPNEMKQFEEREISLLVSLDKLERELKSERIDNTNIDKEISKLEDLNYDMSEIQKSIENIEDKILDSEKNDPENIKKQISDVEENIKKLSKHANTEQLETAVNELKKITITGKLLSENVRLSNNMSAKLKGDGFEISGPNDEIKAVGASSITEWKWNIKALKPNTQKITVTLYAHINLGNTSSPYRIDVFEQNIDVEVSILGYIVNFYNKYWEFIWGTILIPLLIWLFNKIRRRNNKS